MASMNYFDSAGKIQNIFFKNMTVKMKQKLFMEGIDYMAF
jgi:hypothetical protein